MNGLKFLCSSCGACCRRASNIQGFDPDWVLEDGSCINLMEDNTCGIYENRPLVCQVEAHWDQREEKDKVSKLEHFVLNNLKCNEFMAKDGMEESYLINIGNYDLMDEL